MLTLYVPILILAGLAAAFAVFSLAVGALSGPKRWNRAKLQAYESGIEPTPQPRGGGRFPVKYYVTAMLFILFDIEVLFLYPIAIQLKAFGTFAMSELIVFVVLLMIAFVYVWRRGALSWK